MRIRPAALAVAGVLTAVGPLAAQPCPMECPNPPPNVRPVSVLTRQYLRVTPFAAGTRTGPRVADATDEIVVTVRDADPQARMIYQSIAEPEKEGPRNLVAIFHLRNTAAEDVARALVGHLGKVDRGVRVVVTPSRNELFIDGRAETVAAAERLVEAIDAPLPEHLLAPRVVRVPVTFLTEIGFCRADAPHEHCMSLTERECRMLEVALRVDAARVCELGRARVRARDNQTAAVEFGESLRDGRSEVALHLTPRSLPDVAKMLVRAEVTLTRAATSPVVVPGAGASFPINVQTIQTTWIYPTGGAALLRVPGDDNTELLILLPHTVARN